LEDLPEMVFKIDEESESFDPKAASETPMTNSKIIKDI